MALGAATALSLWGGWLHLNVVGADGPTWLDWARTALFTVALFWLAWGALPGLIGALAPARRQPETAEPPTGRTAILVPVYNEDPPRTFARIAAMNASLIGLGYADRFHFAVLSDTTSESIAIEEAWWFQVLLREPEAQGRIFYRRRRINVGRKAGNIEDFISRSGAAYDYALILDADSLMAGETIAELARRMDREPRLGLLQTGPKIINATTLFGRCQQFAAAYLTPSFVRGIATLEGREGPYWGHNAIVRVRAFAESCGLPTLRGKAPTGGHILSHDFVEAALLARAGWTVAVEPELGGSFEEGPENLVEYAKRDRRWCQGNLQHRKIIGASGLKFWSRVTLLQGIMSYLSSPLWLSLLILSIAATIIEDAAVVGLGSEVWTLAAIIAGTLLVPKLAIFVRRSMTDTNRGFGGHLAAAGSLIAEIGLSSVLAPTLMLLQCRAVVQILLGFDGGWPPTRRSATDVSVPEAFAVTWWIVLLGLLALASASLVPQLLPWLLPVVLPMIGAPVLIWATSLSTALLFATPVEVEVEPIVAAHREIEARWRRADSPRDDGAIVAHAAA